MKQNNQLANPMLLGAIELMKAENTDENRKLFVDELMKAHFLAPVEITPAPQINEDGMAMIAPDSEIQCPMLNTKSGVQYYMAFTDWNELKKWQNTNKQQTFMFRFEDYAGMLLSKDKDGNPSPAAGFVIDPFGSNVVIHKEMAMKYMEAKMAQKEKKDKEAASESKPAAKHCEI